MGKKTSKSTKKVTKYKFSPKDADKVMDEMFEKDGIKIRNIIRFTPEPFFFRQTIEGLKPDDNKRD